MIRPRSEANEQMPVQAKRRNSVADALMCFGRYGENGFAEFLKSSPLVRIRVCARYSSIILGFGFVKAISVVLISPRKHLSAS